MSQFLKKKKTKKPQALECQQNACFSQGDWEHHGADIIAVPTVQSQSGSKHQETLNERISSSPLTAQPNCKPQIAWMEQHKNKK